MRNELLSMSLYSFNKYLTTFNFSSFLTLDLINTVNIMHPSVYIVFYVIALAYSLLLM